MPSLFSSRLRSRLALSAFTVCAMAFGTVALADSLSVAARNAAAQDAAKNSRLCRNIGDFYWEIGDGKGPIVSGTVGSTYGPDKEMKIASASKWVFGAYVLEKIGGNQEPSEDTVADLEMQSGHVSFNPLMCAFSRTIGGCQSIRRNANVDDSAVGRFSYGGGHSQALAVKMGLGNMTPEQLTTEIRDTLGGDLGFAYERPQLAGGMVSTPTQYAQFLRKIINGDLRMVDYLDYRPVCTQCGNALQSPVKEAWHYSLNHWIEDEPDGGDGAYSSPGLLGFYPWISKDRNYYGVLAREHLSAGSYWESVLCGRQIRHAWMQGADVPDENNGT